MFKQNPEIYAGLESQFVFMNLIGDMDSLPVYTDTRGHVCDKVWLVTNVHTRQKFTYSVMLSEVYPNILQTATTLGATVNGESHVVVKEGQVCVIPNQMTKPFADCVKSLSMVR